MPSSSELYRLPRDALGFENNVETQAQLITTPPTAESNTASNDGNLRRAIEEAISPWAASRTKPPFSGEQLVTMALMCSTGPVSICEICTWIFDHFAYYRGVFATSIWNGTSWPYTDAKTLRSSIIDALLTVEIPFEAVKVQGKYGVGIDQTFKLNKHASRLLLSSTLSPRPEAGSSTFPFFNLPAKLRANIYDMVFTYPKPGLRMWKGEGRFVAFTKDFSHNFDFQESKSRRFDTQELLQWDGMLHTRPISQILAPLLVSRQFYNEAMPAFYRMNRFCFHSLSDLESFLENTSLERRRYIRRIVTTYNIENAPIATQTFKLLASVDHLHQLDIHIEEEMWLKRSQGGKIKKYSSVRNMPGLSTLRSMQVDAVNFHDCPIAENMLKADMVRPRDDGEKGSGLSKKRKAVGKEVGAQSEDKMTKKARTR